MLGTSSRDLADLAAPGSLTASAVILFLSFAWSGVDAPRAQADIEIPYQVTAPTLPDLSHCCLHHLSQWLLAGLAMPALLNMLPMLTCYFKWVLA